MRHYLMLAAVSLVLVGCTQQGAAPLDAPVPALFPIANISPSDSPSPLPLTTGLTVKPAASPTALVSSATPNPTPAQTLPPKPVLVAAANLSVHFINVSLGEAIFIDSGGLDVLLDGGCRSCAQQILSYLKSINASPDVVVPTNHDEDHMGGLIAFLNSSRLLQVWDSNSTKATKVYADYVALARSKNFTVVERGQVFWLDDYSKLTVLNPVQPLEFSKENDNSIAFKLEHGNSSFMFAGDCEAACEKSMLAAGLDVSASVLKAGHHCSRTSTTDAFLDAVKPKIAVCGAGVTGHAKYGHPHEEVLSKFRARGITYYVAMRNGTVVLS